MILKHRKKIKIFIRIFLSIALLYLVLKRISFPDIHAVLSRLSICWLSFGLLISFVNIIFLAMRSMYILNSNSKYTIKLSKSYLYYLFGAFYNNFLPSMIGGDFLRMYHITKEGPNLYEASASVILERIGGLLGVILLASTSTLFLFKDNTGIVVSLITLVLGYFIFAAIIFNQNTVTFVQKLSVRRNVAGKFFSKIFQFISILYGYANKKIMLVLVLLFSLSSQLGDIFVTYIYGLSLGINIPFYFYLAFIPIIYIVTMLPVSINGLGLREGIVVFLFTKVGVPESQALVLSFLIYFDKIVKGIVGGILLLFSNLTTLKAEIRKKKNNSI